MVPRENKNNAYAKFWRAKKEYYGIFESDLWPWKATMGVINVLINVCM